MLEMLTTTSNSTIVKAVRRDGRPLAVLVAEQEVNFADKRALEDEVAIRN